VQVSEPDAAFHRDDAARLFPEGQSVNRRPSGKPRPDGSTQALVRRHAALFERRVGAAYPVNWQKECAIVKRLLATYPPERIEALQDAYFAAGDDSFAAEGGFTVGVFANQVPRLLVAGAGQTSRGFPRPDLMSFDEFCLWKRGREPAEMPEIVREALRREWSAVHG